MTLYERHKDEILTDNTQFHEYEQCRDCKHWGNGMDYFTNAYDKGNCDMFMYPDRKPTDIAQNKEKCKYREPR